MAVNRKPKPEKQKGLKSNRANGKAPKQHPKPNNYGATGRTVNGYKESSARPASIPQSEK
jgi:hypothetical protein